jgi:hypothetical protein
VIKMMSERPVDRTPAQGATAEQRELVLQVRQKIGKILTHPKGTEFILQYGKPMDGGSSGLAEAFADKLRGLGYSVMEVKTSELPELSIHLRESPTINIREVSQGKINLSEIPHALTELNRRMTEQTSMPISPQL